jgi:uncharacterized protein with NRDE domain
MCLILFAINSHPKFSLMLAANRDEFLARPTRAMQWWDSPRILAGKDLQAGGTWMGIDETGRWGAVTNFRGPGGSKPNARSRGELVTSFLSSRNSPNEFLQSLQTRLEDYSGFNLLVSDGQQVWYITNRTDTKSTPVELKPGVYGLSNHSLDTPWPKVQLGKSKLTSLLESSSAMNHESMFNLLSDDSRPEDEALPDTGIGLEKERLLSSMFIESPNYGTRCSTSLFIGKSGVRISERTIQSGSTVEFSFQD